MLLEENTQILLHFSLGLFHRETLQDYVTGLDAGVDKNFNIDFSQSNSWIQLLPVLVREPYNKVFYNIMLYTIVQLNDWRHWLLFLFTVQVFFGTCDWFPVQEFLWSEEHTSLIPVLFYSVYPGVIMIRSLCCKIMSSV